MNTDLQFYGLKCGLSKITKKLTKYLKQNSCKILLKKEVKDIVYDSEKSIFTLSVSDNNTHHQYQSKKCILAIPKPDLLKFKILKGVDPILKSIGTKSLCRIYSIFKKDDIWFKDISKTTTNNNSRYIIPIDKEHGLIMISYSDSKFAHYWKRLKEKSESKFINELIKNIYKTFHIKINTPIYTKMCYWELGTGFWLKDKDSTTLSKKILKPYNSIPLYICGENYSESQGWMEGALETSEKIIMHLK
jgi:hypothetical protein